MPFQISFLVQVLEQKIWEKMGYKSRAIMIQLISECQMLRFEHYHIDECAGSMSALFENQHYNVIDCGFCNEWKLWTEYPENSGWYLVIDGAHNKLSIIIHGKLWLIDIKTKEFQSIDCCMIWQHNYGACSIIIDSKYDLIGDTHDHQHRVLDFTQDDKDNMFEEVSYVWPMPVYDAGIVHISS